MKDKKPYDFPPAFHQHYKVPENYFEEWEQRWPPVAVSPPRRRRLSMWLSMAAASVVVLIAWGLYRQGTVSTLPSSAADTLQVYQPPAEISSPDTDEDDWDGIPDEVIEDYLLADADYDMDI